MIYYGKCLKFEVITNGLFELNGLVGYFHLFIVTTGCPSEQRPQKTVSRYGG